MAATQAASELTWASRRRSNREISDCRVESLIATSCWVHFRSRRTCASVSSSGRVFLLRTCCRNRRRINRENSAV